MVCDLLLLESEGKCCGCSEDGEVSGTLIVREHLYGLIQVLKLWRIWTKWV